MDSNINLTLKRMLFDSPSVVSAKLYRESRDIAFPNEELFKEFLTESDEQKRTQVAKDIILRLAFCSPFYTPNRYLYNLLHFEQKTVKNNHSGFTPQDHFIHSVYLYLLGIYIFFYHPSIHSAVLSHFKHCRMTSEKSKILHRRSTADSYAVSDFLFAWRLFALAHDVGYPWENKGSLEEADCRKPFFDLKKALEKECSLRVLAKCVTLMRLINKQREVPFKHELVNLPQGSANRHKVGSDNPDTYDWTQMNAMSDWLRLPQINGLMYARTIASIYESDSVLAVLESRYADQPVLFLIPDGLPHCVITKSKSLSKFGTVDYLCRSAFSTGKPPNSSYTWQYYVKSPKQGVLSFLSSSLGKGADSLFNKLNEGLTIQEVPPLTFLTTDREYTEYAFLIYRALLTSFHYDLPYSEQEELDNLPEFMKKYNLASKVIHEQFKNFAEDIGESIKRSIKNHVNSKDIRNIQDKPINEKVAFYFNRWSSKKAMVDEVRKDIAPKLQTRIDQVLSKLSAYELVRETLRMYLPDVNPFDDKTNTIDLHVINSLPVTTALLQRFGNMSCPYIIESEGRLSMSPLLEYRPSFAKENSDKFIDHGVASACAMLGAQHIVQSAFDRIKTDTTGAASRLLCLGLNIAAQCQLSFSEHAIGTLSIESIAAIAIHNVYPEDMVSAEARNYRTSLRDDPFSFLALLCDSLQPWDRRKLIDQGERDLLFKTTSGQFDIQIRGNEILIIEGGRFLSLDDRKEKLRSQLDAFLADASILIRLNLREW